MKTQKRIFEFGHKDSKNFSNKFRSALFSLCLLTFVGAYGQTGQVNLQMKNASLKQMFKAIEGQTSYYFSYRDSEINGKGGITFAAKNIQLKQLLTEQLSKLGLQYQVVGKKIVITPVDKVRQSSKENKIMGRVVDTDGIPVIGATIKERGTVNGTITDFDGNFSLSVSNDAVIEVSYIGYKTKVINKISNKKLAITLYNDTKVLDEVVVVGYGVQKKASVTAAISTVESKDLKMSSAPNLGAALQGKLPGLNIIQNSGQPGADNVTMYLRGAGTLNGTAPLIMIDGVPRSDMNALDPNEIDNISILKDASATAVFGVRGANGVIMITTKRGHKGKPSFGVTVKHTLQYFSAMPEHVHSWDYARLRNEAYLNDNPGADPESYPFTDYMINKYKSGEDPIWYPDRNIHKEYFHKAAPMTRVSANFNGGGDRFRYFLNAGYVGQGSMMKTEDKNSLGYDPSYRMSRYTFRVNVDYNIFKNLKASLNLATYWQKKYGPGLELYGGDMDWAIHHQMGLIQATAPSDPGPTTVEGFGAPAGLSAMQTGNTGNVHADLNRRGYSEFASNKLFSTFILDWDLGFITKGLSAKAMYSYDAHSENRLIGNRYIKQWKPIVARNENEKSHYIPTSPNDIESIRLSKSMHTSYVTNFQASLNYARTFKKHNVTGMFLFQKDKWEQFGADLPYNVIGLVGRATYNYDNRYLAEFNIGYNGSEQFAKDNRFGTFPSYSFGWNASNEEFLKDNKIISNLKLRASYGITGNDGGGGRFLYLSDIKEAGGIFYSLNRGKTVVQGKIGNPALQWELSKKTNLGLNLELFRQLQINIDIFNEKRDHILIGRHTVPQIQGVNLGNLPKMNLGKVKNRGHEIELIYRNKFDNGLFVTFSGNYNYNKNKILFCDEVQRDESWSCRYRQTGYSIGQNFGYLIDYSNGNGFINTQEELDNLPTYKIGKPRLGDFKYIDTNKDGFIDEKDEVAIGYSSIPRVTYAFGTHLEYKNFDLSINFTGVGKRTSSSEGLGITETYGPGNYHGWHFNAWTQERYNNHEKILYPALSLSDNCNHRGNSVFIFDRSYLRLQLVELGYCLPESITRPLRMQQCRIHVSGNNLFTWHKMPVDLIDPEQTDLNAYPLLRMVNFGIDIKF